ncbi:ATP-binding protein [Persephonella sp. IF05-L8]|uniref:helicase HerA domain-containing protein n=1 Tax=Persephonella sp. IF05-L8 TaxID=1158338 RepID=UPI000495AA70
MKQIGICVGSTRPNRVNFLSDDIVRIGQFVVLKYEEEGKNKSLLGMIQRLERDNPYLTETIRTPQQVKSIKKFSEKENILKGEIQILGEIIDIGDEVFLQIPRTPPLPATEVYEADPQLLKKIFGAKSKKFVKIGRLLSEKEEVPVYVDIEQIVLRHLAVLAVTGAGKSNTVSVLLKNITNLGGTVAVFDFHGEYTKSKITRNGKSVINHIQPLINPALLKPKEFASLIGIKPNAYVQFRYFRIALEYTINKFLEEKREQWQNHTDTQQFLNRLKQNLEDMSDPESEIGGYIKGKIREDSLFEVINKLEDLELELGHVVKLGVPPLIDNIKPGMINVFDFSELDEDVADAIASNILRWALEERKKAVRQGNSRLPFPLMIVVEEAHILAGEKRNTEAKYYLARIAREGRKFGLGITVVTQRPKGLDKEILSQMNNMIILKLVEPEDQKHVQRASEALSQELMDYLPGLNPGEAIIIGNMTKIPLLVKIDKAEEKIEGNDIDVVGQWEEILKEEGNKVEDILSELDNL